MDSPFGCFLKLEEKFITVSLNLYKLKKTTKTGLESVPRIRKVDNCKRKAEYSNKLKKNH